MLSGLILDTLLKPPTTHPTDYNIAPELAELAGSQLGRVHGLQRLRQVQPGWASAEELIDIDAKHS